MTFRKNGLSGLITITLLGLCTLIACNVEKECDIPNVSYVNIMPYDTVDGEVQHVKLNSFIAWGIENPDYLFYDTVDELQIIRLPLKRHNWVLCFALSFDGVVDTIRFTYGTSNEFLSYSCGFTSVFEIIEFKTSSNCIDTFTILNEIVDTSDQTNIKLYLNNCYDVKKSQSIYNGDDLYSNINSVMDKK
jgi:hypothetical protein